MQQQEEEEEAAANLCSRDDENECRPDAGPERDASEQPVLLSISANAGAT